eukprot:gene13869-16359_t
MQKPGDQSPPSSLVDVVAFDLGGVLFSAGKEVAKVSWERRGYDSKLIKELLVSPESMELRKGNLTDSEFWDIFMKSRLPESHDVNVIKKIWYDAYVIDQDVVALLMALRWSGYRIAAFSGNIPSRIEYLEEKYNFRRLFDFEIYSYDCGMTKPDAKFVEHLIKTIFPTTATSPDTYPELGRRILYVDDNEKDAEPAKLYNVPTLIYRRGDIDSLRARMVEIGIKFKRL